MTEKSISYAALQVLNAGIANEKVRLTFNAAKNWSDESLAFTFGHETPSRPNRPEKPELVAPKDMPRRRNAKARAARIAMLHAIAHIELNAIDLAWDIVLRFGKNMPREFTDDWIKVANDEAKHFELLNGRLGEFDSYYGALPAHDGLWQSAEKTAHDLKARLAVVPMVLEARGLDVTPALIDKFKKAEDQKSVSALEIIYREEIDHVHAGQKWFNYLCKKERLNPAETYQYLVQKYFAGNIKPPLNIEARDLAGLEQAYYLPLVES